MLTLWITFAATKPSASCSTNGVVSSLYRSCQHLLTTPSKPLFEILYRHMNVHSCSHIIIFGYWVGPDIDDGWGYVEAFVNQITWQENSFLLLATVLLACLAVYEILMNGPPIVFLIAVGFHKSIKLVLKACLDCKENNILVSFFDREK